MKLHLKVILSKNMLACIDIREINMRKKEKKKLKNERK